MNKAKVIVNKFINKAGYSVTKTNNNDIAPNEPQSNMDREKDTCISVDPADYSTTDNPQEVPCQKVVYYHALKKYITPQSKVLDVGCGLGYGMAIMSVVAKEVHGIDVDIKAVNYSRNEYLGNNPKIRSIQKYNGYKTPFPDKTFDVVTCVDVLEHVKDYHKFLIELLRISKKYVIISTPNQRPEFTNEDGTPKNHWHLREWKPAELESILSKYSDSAKTSWFYIDGEFEGPFKVVESPTKVTLVLMPVLRKV